MRYCKAYPFKKMIPASSSQLDSPCFSNCEKCAVYNDVSGKRTPVRSVAKDVQKTTDTPMAKKGEEQKLCVWLRQETVSYRLCTRNYECQSCTFEQMLLEHDSKYEETPMSREDIKRLKQMPANHRRCKYTVTGKVLYQPCDMDYECWKCAEYKQIKESIVENYIAEAKK